MAEHDSSTTSFWPAEKLDGEDLVEEAESDWEDEEDDISKTMYSRTAGQAERTGTHTKMLRKRRQTTFSVNGSRRHVPPLLSNETSKPGRTSLKSEELLSITREVLTNGALHGVSFTTRYSLDVLGRALHYFRYPVSLFVFLWLFVTLMTRIRRTLQPVVDPFCVLPGISSFPICRSEPVKTPTKRRPQWADYPRLVEAESKSFDLLLHGFAGGSALSFEVKQAEMATADLVALVRISDLKAKDTLATSLVNFIDDAKQTGRALQRLSSKVGGAVDNIMAVNDYALKSIDSARASEPSLWFIAALSPWKTKRKATNEIVTETFEEAMNVLSKNLERLIIEAEVNRKNLHDLEERLATLHDLVAREDSSISSAKSDLLAELWTKLGGNKRKLSSFDGHLALLKDLATYRKQALAHVVTALQTLRGMNEDMEDMRERVAAPDLIGSSVPVEVHMKSIEMGLERLKEGRSRAKQLEEEAIRRVLSIAGVD